MEIISNIISGIIGGLVVYFVQRYFEKKHSNKNKLLTNEKLNLLQPGISLDFGKNILGQAIRINEYDLPISLNEFEPDESIKTNSYLFRFTNAYVKITSTDNKNIDSITVIANDRSLHLENYVSDFNLNSNVMNKARVTKDLLNSIVNHQMIRTIRDSCFAISLRLGYKQITLFGYPQKAFDYIESNDANYFLGDIISGFCVSETHEYHYYIYMYELLNEYS